MRSCGKIWQSRTGHRWQQNTAHALCVLGKQGCSNTLRIYNIAFHGNIDHANASQFYVIRTLLVLSGLVMGFVFVRPLFNVILENMYGIVSYVAVSLFSS